MASKKKVLYCRHCGKETVHNFICKESAFEDAPGFGRALVAIFTLGLTETTFADKKYECSRCGEIQSC